MLRPIVKGSRNWRINFNTLVLRFPTTALFFKWCRAILQVIVVFALLSVKATPSAILSTRPAWPSKPRSTPARLWWLMMLMSLPLIICLLPHIMFMVEINHKIPQITANTASISVAVAGMMVVAATPAPAVVARSPVVSRAGNATCHRYSSVAVALASLVSATFPVSLLSQFSLG